MRTNKMSAPIGVIMTIAAVGVPPAEANDVPEGMVAFWRAEGNAQDSVGENHGTLVGGASFTNGMEGQSFAFDGASGYVELTNAGDLDFGTNDFTVCAWAFFSSSGGGLSSDQTIFHKVLGSYPNDRGYFLEYVSGEPQPVLRFMVRDTTANANDLMLPAPICTGHWFHIAGVRSGNVNRIYLDGSPLGEQVAGSNVDIGIGGSARIGSLAGLFGNARFFSGALDEVSLYGRALTQAELFRLSTMKPTLSLRKTQDQLEIAWASQSNRSYEVRHSGDLRTNSWVTLGSPVVATGLVSVAYDSVPEAGAPRFYQVTTPAP